MMSTDAPLLSSVISLLSLALCVGASNGAPPGKVPAKVPAKVGETPKASATIELIEFPDLVDATRGAKAPTEPSRPRLLPRRKQEEPAAPAATGRKVPIKVHVPSTGGPFPVIVVSHGAGGDWDTHFTQAQELASGGYIVLCIEHVGSSRERVAKGLQAMKSILAMTRDANEVLTRPKDVSFAIDRATEWNATHAKLKGRLDLSRIGVMGHSFGAFTTMVVCGMRPAVDWLTPTVAPGKGLGPDLRDQRVKCGVALSPQGVGEPLFVQESFASLAVPLLGITGTKDDQQAGQPASVRKDAFAFWPQGQHIFVWLANARHQDFTSAGSNGGSLPSQTRDDVQPVTRIATRAFFDLHLKSDGTAAETLCVEGLKPFLRGAVNKAEVLSK
ncbi:MAG: alpha/beta hydrolase family protein [bacterium]